MLLGCPKNRVDAEALLGALVQNGYPLTSDLLSAGLIVVTTCGFLGRAVAESERAIRRALALKRGSPERQVVVAGCLVQRFGRGLEQRFPEVDLWVGIDELCEIPRLLGPERGESGTGETARFRCRPVPCSLASCGQARVCSTPPHYAYLKVADGCDNRCSYCLIPSIRGPLRSRTVADVVAEAHALVGAGARELILVAQDTTAFGIDRVGRSELGRLLDELERNPRLRWLRLMYCHPAHLTPDLVERFRSSRRLCRYIDLPIQHAATRIQKRMNRHCTRAELTRLLASLRAMPEMHIRTTVMVGFPGERAADFRELLEFIREVRFDRLSGYVYSAEAGTRAAAFSDQVPAAVGSARLRRVMELQAKISRARLRRLVGREVEVIVDSPGIGRTQWDAPEVDGIVRLVGAAPEPGEVVRCRVVRSFTHDIVGRVL